MIIIHSFISLHSHFSSSSSSLLNKFSHNFLFSHCVRESILYLFPINAFIIPIILSFLPLYAVFPSNFFLLPFASLRTPLLIGTHAKVYSFILYYLHSHLVIDLLKYSQQFHSTLPSLKGEISKTPIQRQFSYIIHTVVYKER